MGQIVRINQPEIDSAQEFSELVEKGEVTHGIICYRKKDGTICYRLFNQEHLTYIMGLMSRTIVALHNASEKEYYND